MPRVSEEHLTARREQILRAAQRCVVRQGFHRTTMAHVLAESGLSAGAVYRYFTSKEQLLEAIAARSLGSFDSLFEDLLADGQTPEPADVLAAALDQIVSISEQPDGDMTVLAVQAWAEGALGGPIHDLVGGYIRRLRDHWVEVARRQQSAGRLRADADPHEVGQVLVALMPGFIVQRLLTGDVSAQSFVAGLRPLLGEATRHTEPPVGIEPTT